MREKPYFRDWIESFKDPVMDAFVSDRSILSLPEPNSMRKTSDSHSLLGKDTNVYLVKNVPLIPSLLSPEL